MRERTFSGDEWREYLALVDRRLDAPAQMLVIGGGAIALQYSRVYATRDLDTVSRVDARLGAALEDAGRDFGEQHGLRDPPPVSRTGTYDAPEGFEERCQHVDVPGLRHLEVLVPERHDLAIMKTARGDERDINALADLHRGGQPFDLAVLVERYRETSYMGRQERFRSNFLVLADELYGRRVADELTPVLEHLDATPRRLEIAEDNQLVRSLAEPALRLAAQVSSDREWRGTLCEALRESERAAPGPVAFVSADWKKHARIRVESADRLTGLVARVSRADEGSSAAATEPAVYTVREDGTIHNTATGRDEYVRVDADSGKYPQDLQAAVAQHFGADAPATTPPGRDPEVDGP